MNMMRSLRDGLMRVTRWKGNDTEKVGDLSEYNTDSDDDDDNGGENVGDVDHDAICGICMDRPIYFDSSTRFKNYPKCKHYDNNYCNSCLYKYTSEQIESKKFGFIKCPYPSCKHQFKKKLIKEVIEDNAYSNYMTEKRNIREELKCRANPFYAIKKYALTAWDNLVINLKSLGRRGMINSSSRRCPSCSYIIEKNGGCQHMTCCVCKHEFYWCCGMSYSSNHNDITCLVSKYWFSWVLVAGLVYLLQPLFALLADLLVKLDSIYIYGDQSDREHRRDVLKTILGFIINVPDAVYCVPLLRITTWHCHEIYYTLQRDFGIPYLGATFSKFLDWFNRNRDIILGIHLFATLYFAPTYGISSTLGLLVASTDSLVSSSSISLIHPYISHVFGLIKAIALHPITIEVVILAVWSFLSYYTASSVKVLVAFNIEKMKKNVRSIVVTPSMEELTTRIPSTSRLFILETYPFILEDIKTYWRLKYSINNPLVSVLVIDSLYLLLKHSKGQYFSLRNMMLLWEMLCFVWQFNSIKDCGDGILSLLGNPCYDNGGRSRGNTVELMLPHEPAFFFTFLSIVTYLGDAINVLSLFNNSLGLGNVIGGLLCNPTIVVFLTLALSVYYYVTRVI